MKINLIAKFLRLIMYKKINNTDEVFVDAQETTMLNTWNNELDKAWDNL